MALESSSKPDFSQEENKLRTIANSRLLKLLEDPDAEVPAGQLMAFVSKVGFRIEPEKVDQPQIGTQNVLNIIGGLPPERQEQIVAAFEKQARDARSKLESARKELPRGG